MPRSILQILRDQGGQFWGGFLEGLNQSIQQAQQRNMERERLESQKKLYDLQLKQHDLNQKIREQDLRDKMAKSGSIEELARAVGGETVTPTEGPVEESGRGPAPVITPSTDPKQRLKAAMVRAGLAKEALTPAPKTLMEQFGEIQAFQKAAGGQQQAPSVGAPPTQPAPTQPLPNVKFNAKGQAYLAPAGMERQPLGEMSSAFRQYSDSRKAEGWTSDQIREGWIRERAKFPEAGAAGAEQGKLGVRQTPEYLQQKTAEAAATAAGQPLPASTAQQISTLDTLINQTIGNIRNNLDPNFLGPVKGTDIAFEARRRIGSMVGAPVGERETMFRTALKDAGDQLLRARSGAQINEQEYQRLQAILPKATDEPQVFNAALNRFESELRALMRTKIETARTPRGKIGNSVSVPTKGRLVPIP